MLCLNSQECSLNAGELELWGLSVRTLLKILQLSPADLLVRSAISEEEMAGGGKCRSYTMPVRERERPGAGLEGFPKHSWRKALGNSPKGEGWDPHTWKGLCSLCASGLIHEVPPNRGKSRAVSAAGLGLGCGHGARPAEVGEVPECSPWDHRAGQLLLSG